MNVLIMAGGSGSRLWPVSRKKQPKQLLKLVDDKTLLQTTFARLSKGFSANQIFVATTLEYGKAIKKQLPSVPQNHYSLEPCLCDRGPAIGLAALIMHNFNKNGSFVTSWSDHYIKNEKEYFRVLKLADNYLKTDPSIFIAIGVSPSSPHTGLGYIETGKNLDKAVKKVTSYTEKPDLATAKKFIESGNYLWNTGYFVCRTDTLLKLYEQHLPEVYKILMRIKPFIGSKKQQWAINKYYPDMPKVDIEKGLVEKLNNVAVVPATFDWADVGSWKIIKDVLSGSNQNLTKGNTITYESKGNLVYNYEPKLVAVAGAENLMVINTKDALLIIPKDKAEEVKNLVEKMKQDKKLKKYL